MSTAEPIGSDDEVISGDEVEIVTAKRQKTGPGRGVKECGVLWSYFVKVRKRDDKSNRWEVACKECGTEIASGKTADMTGHVLYKCKGDVKAADKEFLSQKAARAAAAPEASFSEGSATSTRRDVKRQSKLTAFIDTTKLTDEQERGLRMKQLRAFVSGGIPFAWADSPFFKDWQLSVRPNLFPASADMLRQSLLPAEYARVLREIIEAVGMEGQVVVCVDGWSNRKHQSIMSCVIIFPSTRDTFLLCSEEASTESHTAQFHVGLFKRFIEKVGGPERVVALVTDNAAAVRSGREELVKEDKYRHILTVRCFMHAFNLVMASVSSHPVAKAIITKAQRVVTYFRASHMAGGLLRGVVDLKIKAGEMERARALATSNKTRFTSVLMCLESVLYNELALRAVVAIHHATLFAKDNTDVAGIITDDEFWSGLRELVSVQEPFGKVIMAVQKDSATLGCVTRYWAYLRRSLAAVLPGITDDGYRRHIIRAFNTRLNEIGVKGGKLNRLTLFLDPRYCGMLDSSTDEMLDELKLTAAEIFSDKCMSEAVIRQLLEELLSYNCMDGVFKKLGAIGSSYADLRSFWGRLRTLKGASTLATLAMTLINVVPHAGGVERAFSIMGGFETQTRNRMSSDTNNMLTTVKMWNAAQVPHDKKEATSAPVLRGSPSTPQGAQVPVQPLAQPPRLPPKPPRPPAPPARAPQQNPRLQQQLQPPPPVQQPQTQQLQLPPTQQLQLLPSQLPPLQQPQLPPTQQLQLLPSQLPPLQQPQLPPTQQLQLLPPQLPPLQQPQLPPTQQLQHVSQGHFAATAQGVTLAPAQVAALGPVLEALRCMTSQQQQQFLRARPDVMTLLRLLQQPPGLQQANAAGLQPAAQPQQPPQQQQPQQQQQPLRQEPQLPVPQRPGPSSAASASQLLPAQGRAASHSRGSVHGAYGAYGPADGGSEVSAGAAAQGAARTNEEAVEGDVTTVQELEEELGVLAELVQRDLAEDVAILCDAGEWEEADKLAEVYGLIDNPNICPLEPFPRASLPPLGLGNAPRNRENLARIVASVR
ncbi:hypothetical protein Agub_g6725 [Astrephomene gubernaculifera]|uniref:DUF659 domain-containing protein n=1 Tax=Astrephomene gubernaculifera TaxID=47775 RepID=A0AAD3DQI3_9CHLO|nr:hypothetical protein Agub_g6725 [Astrephomene gubernaculifera]